uniref:ADP-ribosylhydrolase ARH3 n=1 Tax=Arion vulgaris TaxID=1028688 RepID=A0A0B7AEH0_9EUPU
MVSRFKACLIGAVVGDCIGSVYEGLSCVKLSDVISTVSELEKSRQIQRENGTRPAHKHGFRYTDDTAMARSVAASLLENQRFDARDMANRFSSEYFKEPDRGYGGSVVAVFEGLKDSKLADVYTPASMQFGGSGSFGNGGAMRIAPAALYAFHGNNLSTLKVRNYHQLPL